MERLDSLSLPQYSNDATQQRWVRKKIQTSQFIQALWKAATKSQRGDPHFLCLLVQCGWTNQSKKRKDPEPTRRWRNRQIAKFLGLLSGSSDQEIASALSRRFSGISRRRAAALLALHTGITHYYTSLRPLTLALVRRKCDIVRRVFESANTKAKGTQTKVRQTAEMIEKLGYFKAGKRRVSPFNGLTPTVSCLDPQRCFPIMNDQTQKLLRAIGKYHDSNGAEALYGLIGKYGIANSFELDAYAYGEDFPKFTRRFPKKASPLGKNLGLKTEMDSIAVLNAKRMIITKKHNALTNRFLSYLEWRHRAAKENKFDCLIENWKTGRDLLVEAKTGSQGSAGRTQIRQAIGQLFDYRFVHLPRRNVDLAILLPTKPSGEIRRLLTTLDIHTIWFEGKGIRGTIKL